MKFLKNNWIEIAVVALLFNALFDKVYATNGLIVSKELTWKMGDSSPEASHPVHRTGDPETGFSYLPTRQFLLKSSTTTPILKSSTTTPILKSSTTTTPILYCIDGQIWKQESPDADFTCVNFPITEQLDIPSFSEVARTDHRH